MYTCGYRRVGDSGRLARRFGNDDATFDELADFAGAETCGVQGLLIVFTQRGRRSELQ